MITRCPFCHTYFRVRAEQLAARAGQVRCGKCKRVFDAPEHLIEESAPVQEHAAERTNTAAVESAPAAVGNGVAEGQDSAITASPEQGVETVLELEGAEVFEATTHAFEPAQPESVEFGTAPGADAFDFGPAADADTGEHARRWPWLVGAILLLLVLLAQAAYYYRSAILALFPQAKPYAVALCATLRCDLPLPRRIDLMSIEASDLQADTTNPNIMVMSATLKNRAIYDQQFPMLELTLTDPQDQPVVRRVLAPLDYLGKAANVRAGFPANSEIAIKVYFEGSQVKATGYRLYLFYP